MFTKLLSARRQSLDLEGSDFSNAAKHHLANAFLLETGAARQLPGKAQQIAALADIHRSAVSRSAEHASRMAQAESHASPLERMAAEADARKDTLYSLADRLAGLGETPSGRDIHVPERAMAVVAARAANNAGMANEVISVLARSGIEGLQDRTGLDEEKALKLAERAGGTRVLELRSEVASQIDTPPTEAEPQRPTEVLSAPEPTWAEKSASLSDEEFEAAVRTAREGAIAQMFPQAIEDRDTRVKKAAFDKFAEKARPVDIYGAQARMFHSRINRQLPQDSEAKADFAAMLDAVKERGQQRQKRMEQDLAL